jgi:hypothetical protein
MHSESDKIDAVSLFSYIKLGSKAKIVTSYCNKKK